jgi:hypothetical protein
MKKSAARSEAWPFAWMTFWVWTRGRVDFVRSGCFSTNSFYLPDSVFHVVFEVMNKTPEADIEAMLQRMTEEMARPLSPALIAQELPGLVRELKSFDRTIVAATFGGLLTESRLQANCVRLEALVHLALAFCEGDRTPTPKHIKRWFKFIGSGRCGRLEDPAEDVFVTNVTTNLGNHRIFEGISESAGFYLQRVLNVVATMPENEPFKSMKLATLNLLKLSEAVADRASVKRYQLGEEIPQQNLAPEIAARWGQYAGVTTFSIKQLDSLSIEIDLLLKCGLIFKTENNNVSSPIGNAHLDHCPLLFDGKNLVVSLPSSISTCVRYLALRLFMDSDAARQVLVRHLAHEYEACLSDLSFVRQLIGQSIRFTLTKNGVISAFLARADTGLYVSFVFFIDTLEGFEKNGFLGSNPDPNVLVDEFNHCIDDLLTQARQQDGFQECITVVVGCGVGQGLNYSIESKPRANWRVLSVSAADLATLSWLPEFELLDIWRILDAESRLAEHGTTLMNMNGFINLVGWVRDLKGHLVPHGDIPENPRGGNLDVMVQQNALRRLRHSVFKVLDKHVLQQVDGTFIEVANIAPKMGDPDRHLPLYASSTLSSGAIPPIAYVSPKRTWWLELRDPKNRPLGHQYRNWKMLSTWLPRLVPIMEKRLQLATTSDLRLTVTIEDPSTEMNANDRRVTYDEVVEAISISHDSGSSTAHLTLTETFERGLMNETNIAELAFVRALVIGSSAVLGSPLSAPDAKEIAARIAGSSTARELHYFVANQFRDFIRGTIEAEPIVRTEVDEAYEHLGLGWKVHSRSAGNRVVGQSNCMAFLNSLVRKLEDELVEQLRKHNRQEVIQIAVLQHERAANSRDRWRRTSSAIVSLGDEKSASNIVDNESKLNSVFQATRLLIEIAICECPIEGGSKVGTLSFSRLMSKILLIAHYGSCSDAIRWGAMEPDIRITPLGDVHMNYGYFDSIVEPFGRTSLGQTVETSVNSYSENLEQETIRPEISSSLDVDFVESWNHEFGCSLQEMRLFVDEVEDWGIKSNSYLLIEKRSEILGKLSSSGKIANEAVHRVLEVLTFQPRENWRTVPEGFKDADRQPWRFGRRLNVLRRPIVQLNFEADPILAIAPGILRDGFVYSVGNYHRGAFPHWQVRSTEMRSWFGTTYDREGSAFTGKVEKRLKELGWETQTEVRITKALQRSFEKDYGDIDVFAWDKKAGRAVLIECKDLKYKKTPGEIAEQLSDFRGEIGEDGKPDLLRKHLDRVSLVTLHKEKLSKGMRLSGDFTIDNLIVFKNPVPMKFAWQKLEATTRICTFDELPNAMKL